jgi:hypothetical protein
MDIQLGLDLLERSHGIPPHLVIPSGLVLLESSSEISSTPYVIIPP